MAFQHSFLMESSSNLDSQHSSMTSNMPVNPWMQIPPSVMPWTVENRPHLVRFGDAPSENNTWGIPRPKLTYFKRKSDQDFNPVPAKVHITEEKMAAQLKNMHISNNYASEQGFIEGMDKTDCMLPTLILSKEVQNMACFQESILPEPLLPKREKFNKALVLWKPPAGSITSQLISNLQNDSEEEIDNVNNNVSTSDLNTITSTEYSSPSTEMEV